MQNPIPYKVKRENLKFFKTTQGAYWFGLLGHASAIWSFWEMGVPEMAWFNALISVPAFILALVFNRLGQHNLGFTFAFFELLSHQLLATYFVGWGFGAQYWLIYLAGLSFFNPLWGRKIQGVLLFTVAASFVGLYIFCQEGAYTFPPETLKSGYLINAVIAISVLSLLINYFSKSTLKAEEKLIEEKAVTEEQNKQLSIQRDALVVEQDKTYRMLNKIESLFGQQVSQEVARELIQSEKEIDSKTYEVTVMFLDIRDFTVFADSREPAEVARFQNVVFSELIDIVRVHKGIVLQILGDGIMAVFGAPVVHKEHAHNAVKAGYDMVRKVEELGNSGIIPPIKVGIGLNSGKIIAGNVGNETRKFYSLTGTNVIIAARIEQLNKQFNSQFLISEHVYTEIKDEGYAIEDLGDLHLKGIEKDISVYRLG